LVTLIVAGSVALRKNIAAAMPGFHFFLPSRVSRLRFAIDTSPKSMCTGHALLRQQSPSPGAKRILATRRAE